MRESILELFELRGWQEKVKIQSPKTTLCVKLQLNLKHCESIHFVADIVNVVVIQVLMNFRVSHNAT